MHRTSECTDARPCYIDGCGYCDSLPCHFPATVSDRKWQPSCELGAGFAYWNVLGGTLGSLGMCRSERSARIIAAAYNDPAATRATVRRIRATVGE